MRLDSNYGLSCYGIVTADKGGTVVEKVTGATGVIIIFAHRLVVLKLSIVIMQIGIIKEKYSSKLVVPKLNHGGSLNAHRINMSVGLPLNLDGNMTQTLDLLVF